MVDFIKKKCEWFVFLEKSVYLQMLISEKELLDFISQHIGLSLRIDDDIYEKGVIGDDFFELMEVYSDKYKVDMSDFLWYFHNTEEGQNFGSLFFKTPFQRIKRIPVTAKMLLLFANNGKWRMDYPSHFISEKRWDIVFNRLFVGVIVAVLVAIFFIKFNA